MPFGALKPGPMQQRVMKAATTSRKEDNALRGTETLIIGPQDVLAGYQPYVGKKTMPFGALKRQWLGGMPDNN